MLGIYTTETVGFISGGRCMHGNCCQQKNKNNKKCLYKKSFMAVDISSNLCGITGVKVWDRLLKGFPSLH